MSEITQKMFCVISQINYILAKRGGHQMIKMTAFLLLALLLLSACQTANNDYIQQVKPPSDSTQTLDARATNAPVASATTQVASADDKITLIVTMPTTFNSSRGGSRTLEWEVEKMMTFKNENVTLKINHYEADKIEAQLQTAFMSGDAYSVTGDIFLSLKPNIQYAQRGYFTDLYALMDNDDNGSREDYYTNVLQSVEYDGKLPYIPVNFTFDYLVVNKALNNEDIVAFTAINSVSIHDMLQFYSQVSDKKDLLTAFALSKYVYHIKDELSAFIDYEKQSSRFNSEEFVTLLKAFKSAYELEPTKRLEDSLRASVMGANMYCNDFEASQKYMFLMTMTLPLQFLLPYEDVHFTHLIPMTDNQGNVKARFGADGWENDTYGFYAILASTPHKAISWDVIQNALSPDALLSPDKAMVMYPDYCYWINRTTNPKNIFLHTIPEYFNMSKEYAGVTLEGKTSEHRDTALAYFNEVLEMPIASMYAAYDTNITDVVLSEFDLFLNDVQTAEQTAANIHNKVQLYLME